MEPMEPYNSGSIQIGSIDIGSYQSGSQLVLLPIWLPIGAVTNLAPNWCRYQSGSQLVSLPIWLPMGVCNDVMTSEVEYRTTSSRSHCKKKYQFGDTNLDLNWLHITESGTQLPIWRPIWSLFFVMTC
jgi:hypothetical protein